jgi:hypothetical protein
MCSSADAQSASSACTKRSAPVPSPQRGPHRAPIVLRRPGDELGEQPILRHIVSVEGLLAGRPPWELADRDFPPTSGSSGTLPS